MRSGTGRNVQAEEQSGAERRVSLVEDRYEAQEADLGSEAALSSTGLTSYLDSGWSSVLRFLRFLFPSLLFDFVVQAFVPYPALWVAGELVPWLRRMIE